jgi:hypothetical protein
MSQGPFITLYGPKTNPAQALTQKQMAQYAQHQFNNTYNVFAQQGVAQQLAAQYAQAYKPKQFKINGVEMDLDEFLNAIYPDDCAEKTYLALKLTKGNQDDTSSK